LERSVADIEEKFASTSFAQQAALLAARIYQEKARPADARKQLAWVIDTSEDAGYQALARLRLSALLIEEKNFDAARQQLNAKVPLSFEPLIADRLGDIDLLENKPTQAIPHYQTAWKGLDANAEYRRLIAVKLAALGADPEETAVKEPAK